MPLPERDRTGYILVDRVREFVMAGTGLTEDVVIDAQTGGNVRLPKTGTYITVLLGDMTQIARPEIIKQNGQTYARSLQECTAYIDFVRFSDPVKEAQKFQAWMYLQDAITAAYQVGIKPLQVSSIRDVTRVTSGAHERRAQLDLDIAVAIETDTVNLSEIDSVTVRGSFSADQVHEVNASP